MTNARVRSGNFDDVDSLYRRTEWKLEFSRFSRTFDRAEFAVSRANDQLGQAEFGQCTRQVAHYVTYPANLAAGQCAVFGGDVNYQFVVYRSSPVDIVSSV
jgi:hypothetical protein